MKNLCTLILAFAVHVHCAGQSTEQLHWLEGTWQRTNSKPGQTAYETWEVSNTTMKGIGVSLRATDTVFVEHLEVVMKGGKLFYVANVAHNSSAAYFEITDLGDKRFISSNPEHDFPQKIGYSLIGDTLKAFISDSNDEKKVFFDFVRIE